MTTSYISLYLPISPYISLASYDDFFGAADEAADGWITSHPSTAADGWITAEGGYASFR